MKLGDVICAIAALACAIFLVGATGAYAAEEKNAKIEFTYDGSPDDALYRELSDAIYAYQAEEQFPANAECSYDVVSEKSAKKYRKKHKLPEDLELLFSLCNFTANNICETSWYSGKEKCYSGAASLYPEYFELAPDGAGVEAKMLFIFYTPGGEETRRVTNVFEYKYFGERSESGWVISGKSFKGMFDL